MVTPIVDPVVEPAVTLALYPVPPIPVLAVADPVPVVVASPLRPVEGRPQSFRTDDISGRPSGMAPMDQYLLQDASLLLGESTDFPDLPAS